MSKRLTYFASLLLAAGLTLSASAQAAEVHIRIIDGRNGKPIRGEKLNVAINNGAASLMATDKNGTIVVLADSGSRIGVVPNLYVTCQPYKPGETWRFYPVGEILSKGISQSNTCSHLIVSAKPGELILFERPRTFWEGMRL